MFKLQCYLIFNNRL